MTGHNIWLDETLKKTDHLLQDRGWCLWKCSNLGDEVITVLMTGYQPGIEEREQIDAAREKADAMGPEVIYTYSELLIVGESDDIRLLHEVKKIGGKIIGIEVKA